MPLVRDPTAKPRVLDPAMRHAAVVVLRLVGRQPRELSRLAGVVDIVVSNGFLPYYESIDSSSTIRWVPTYRDGTRSTRERGLYFTSTIEGVQSSLLKFLI
jgi:hypothetical protein